MTIDYKLYAELCSAIKEKYSDKYEIYREEPPTVYIASPDKGVWDNYGVKIVGGVFTIAVLCEFDQNDEDADVYVGVKILGIKHNYSQLSNYLMDENPGGNKRNVKPGANGVYFSWPYWKTIKDIHEGLKLFDKLLNDCLKL